MVKSSNVAALSIFAVLLIVSLPATAATEAEVTEDIRSKIQAETNSPVSISTNNGIITLSGNVESQAAADAVIKAAFSVDGVKDVNTENLVVQANPLAPAGAPSQADQDAYITAKVVGMISREAANSPAGGSGVNVETKNGIVYLTGKPDTLQQQMYILNKARTIEGVKDVQSNVTKF